MNELKNILIKLTEINISIEEAVDKLTVSLNKNNIEEMNRISFTLNGLITEHNQKSSCLKEYIQSNNISKFKEVLDKIDDEDEKKELKTVIDIYAKSVEESINKLDIYKSLAKISLDMIDAVYPAVRKKIDFIV